MQRLRSTHGIGTVERGLRFLGIRLRSRPETQELAPAVMAERTRLRDAHDMWLEARETRVAASAEVEYLDEKLGDDVMDLSRAALAEVSGDREDARYKRLFGQTAPSEALRPTGGDEQTRFVKAILAQLTSETGPLPSLRDHAATIEASLTALTTAEARRNDLYVPEATAQAERTAAMDRARRVYNLTHPRLRLLFPGDERLVESFFAELSSPARPIEGTEEDDGETRGV